MGQRAVVGGRDHDLLRLPRVPARAPLRAWQSNAFPIGQHLRARDLARAAAGRLRTAPGVVSERRTRIPHRLVCHPAVAIPRWRRSAEIGPGLSRPPGPSLARRRLESRPRTSARNRCPTRPSYAAFVSILARVRKKTATNTRIASAPPPQTNQNAVQLCVSTPPLLVVKKSKDPPESNEPMNIPTP